MELMIGVPVYREAHPAHEASLEASARRLGAAVYVHRGDSCLARARATLYARFRQQRRPWTNYLQTDDDQSWDPKVLAHLASLNHPVVGLPCSLKYDPPHRLAGISTVRAFDSSVRPEKDGTLRVKYLGGGFILWRADVLAAMEVAYPEFRFTTNNGTSAREVAYHFWGGGVVDDELLSEDYWACELAARLGYEIRCYLPACSPHWAGETAYLPRGYERLKVA